MWRTQCGERILKGAEARVFTESLSSLLDNALLDQFEDYESGVECFDNLTYGQKISVLVTIGNGLLRKDVASVDLTAVVEGAIRAVFQYLTHMHFTEPFASGLAVLLAKNPFDPRHQWGEESFEKGCSEVVNDLNQELVNFWKVLQNEESFRRFRHHCSNRQHTVDYVHHRSMVMSVPGISLVSCPAEPVEHFCAAGTAYYPYADTESVSDRTRL